jgi:HprK-related kinase A
MKLADLTASDLAHRLRGEGVLLWIGPFRARIGTTLPHLIEGIGLLYRHYPLADPGILDFEIRIDPVRGHRRFIKPMAQFFVDGSPAFDPFDRDLAIPMMQWLMNWCIFTRPHQYLILHSAVLERNGGAMILPGPPGAGKSTLCTAMHLRGWRLFSDEVALVTPGGIDITPAPLPPSLKNASIEVIRNYEPTATLGPPVPGTRKGTVAHVQPMAESLSRVRETAPASWVVFPNYQPDATCTLVPTSKARSLLWMAHNAFNYSLLGTTGFTTLADVIDACDCYELTYSKLDDALAILNALKPPTKAAARVGRQTAAAETQPAPVAAPTATHRAGHASINTRLLRGLREPGTLIEQSTAQWNELLRVARNAKVLARLGILAETAGVLADYPAEAQRQCHAARALAGQHHRIARWEVNRIVRALRGIDTSIVLLKGAAYVLADLPASRGRLSSDVDIMVPREHIETVETRLRQHGWEQMKLDAYDQRYYRQWMHELPPMRHRSRRSVIDVHHNILPLTGKYRVDAAMLFADAVPIADTGVLRLDDADMVLHSAAHLFQDGEMAGGLRDVLDLHDLLTDFAARDDRFAEQLAGRADELKLTRPLYYALQLTADLMATPLSLTMLEANLVPGPSGIVRGLMGHMLNRAVLPDPPGPTPFATRASRLALYIRAHWQRMPPGLLVRHLFRKATRNLTLPEDDDTP